MSTTKALDTEVPDEPMPAADSAIGWEDRTYTERISRRVYGMFTRKGNAAVAAAVDEVRAHMAEGRLATPVAIREALQERMRLLFRRFSEAYDSEVWIHLVYAFEDIIPSDVAWGRGWLEYNDDKKWIDVFVDGLGPELHDLAKTPDASDVWEQVWFMYGRLLEARGKIPSPRDKEYYEGYFADRARAFAAQEFSAHPPRRHYLAALKVKETRPGGEES